MAPTKNVATEESRIFTPAHPLPAFRETANAEPSITLADQAYEQIEELIVTGQLSPMSFITEARLQGQLGIGRTPIREAFQRLEVDELVVIVPRRGVMVTDIDFRHHMQVLEVRKILEHLIVVRAARFATEQEKERARQCAESMEIAISQGDSVTFMRLDGLLNDLVNGCAYHPVAVKALRPLRSLSRRFWCRYSHAYPSALELVGGTHVGVLRAMGAGDSEAAGIASDKLVESVEDFARHSFTGGF